MDTSAQNTQSVKRFCNTLMMLYPQPQRWINSQTSLPGAEDYLSPSIISMLPFTVGTFMHIVGIIEVIAGIFLLFRPRIGSYVIMGWLTVIAFTLILEANTLM